VLLALNLFLMRPSAFGQQYSSAAIALSLAIAAVVFVRRGNLVTADADLSHDVGVFLILIGIYLVYTFGVVAFVGRSNMEYAVKELLTTLSIAPAYAYALTDRRFNRVFFRALVRLLSVIGYSSAMTVVLAMIVGLDSLKLIDNVIAGYESNFDGVVQTGGIYFPFTMIYNRFSTSDIELFRVSGFFREAGIFQAVCAFAMAYEWLTRRSRLVLLGLLLGLTTSFSTAGVFVFLATCALMQMRLARNPVRAALMGIALSGFAYFALQYTPYIGLAYKNETHASSISDRTDAMREGVEGLLDNVVGTGIFSDDRQSANINMIAAAGSLGLIAFIVQVLILSGWRFRWNSVNRNRVVICFPLLITALFSQPIAAAPMMYVLVMVSCTKNDDED
jgi:hypothetical protein